MASPSFTPAALGAAASWGQPTGCPTRRHLETCLFGVHILGGWGGMQPPARPRLRRGVREQPMLGGPGRYLHPRGESELVQDVADVDRGGPLRDHQRRGDLTVA